MTEIKVYAMGTLRHFILIWKAKKACYSVGVFSEGTGKALKI